MSNHEAITQTECTPACTWYWTCKKHKTAHFEHMPFLISSGIPLICLLLLTFNSQRCFISALDDNTDGQCPAATGEKDFILCPKEISSERGALSNTLVVISMLWEDVGCSIKLFDSECGCVLLGHQLTFLLTGSCSIIPTNSVRSLVCFLVSKARSD